VQDYVYIKIYSYQLFTQQLKNNTLFHFELQCIYSPVIPFQQADLSRCYLQAKYSHCTADTTKTQIIALLNYHNKAKLHFLLCTCLFCKIQRLGKVDKVYLDNTNLIFSLAGEKSNIGNIRETFFLNQMRVKNEVISSKNADFIIKDYTFEIGGKNKQQKQIEKDGKSYIVKDDIEFGYMNIIPLWTLGLNY
jgi:hypothetical protein